MQHRDKIILQKVISEIDIGFQMLGDAALEELSRSSLEGSSRNEGHCSA